MTNIRNSPLSKILIAIVIATIPLGPLSPQSSNAQSLSSQLKDRQRVVAALHRIVGDDSRALLGFTPRIAIVKSRIPNAYATGREIIVISSGLLDLLANEAELQFVLAHELAHLILGHTRTVQTRALVSASQNSEQLEMAADSLALKLLAQAGIASGPATALLDRIQGEEVAFSILTAQEKASLGRRVENMKHASGEQH